MIAIVRSEKDVRVLQISFSFQFLHHLLHQVVYRQKSAPPSGMHHKKVFKIQRETHLGND